MFVLWVSVAGLFLTLVLPEGPLRVFVPLASATALVIVLFLDSRLERARARQQTLDNQARLAELLQSIKMTGRELAIDGSTQISNAIIAAAIGLLSLMALLVNSGWAWLFAIVGIPVFAFGCLSIVRCVSQMGKPVIRLTPFGFWTPDKGDIPWSEVHGIDMIERKARGESLGYWLHLYVPGLRAITAPSSLINRILGFTSRKIVTVVLRSTSEHPMVVENVAKGLWTRATGRDLSWSSLLSDELNESIRKDFEMVKQLDQELKAGRFDVADSLLRENSKAHGVRGAEPSRYSGSDRWVAWVVMTAIILFVAGMLVNAFLGR